MNKIKNYHASCERWRAGRNVKGKLLGIKECWACFYNLFGYCWFDDCQTSEKILSALYGDINARIYLHKLLEFEKR